MMTLENLAGIVVAQRGRGRAGDFKEKIYTHGEIGSIQESGSMFIDQMPYAVDFAIPAGGADYHVFTGADAGFDVGDDAMRRGEVDDCVDCTQFFGGEGDAVFVFLC